jgi:antitoxin component YwqK of YwqJK toxin-antitoxin module
MSYSEIEYDSEKKNILKRSTYNSDSILIKYEVWYKNRNKNIDCSFKNGKEDGISYVWFADGKLQQKFLFKDGKLEKVLYNFFEIKK